MDKGQYTAMVFIDLKKAFDTVDGDILLKKLTKYGNIGLENTWFASYLDNRMQFHRGNGVSSTLDKMKLWGTTRLLSWSSFVFDIY